MTVAVQTPAVPYTGDGVTVVFPFAFRLDDPSWIRVTVDGQALDLGVNYVVEGGGVRFYIAPQMGAAIAISRRSPDAQLKGFPNINSVVPRTLEDAYDRAVMGLQELRAASDRALLTPLGEPTLTLPSLETRKNKFAAFSGTGALIAAAGLVGVPATDLGAQIAQAATQAQARQLIGAAKIPWVDITDAPYNARMTGLAADAAFNTAALQAAIDSLPNSGGFIYVPAGVLVIRGVRQDGSAGGKSWVQIMGAGQGATVIRQRVLAGDLSNMFLALGGVGHSINSLTLDQDRANNPAIDYPGLNGTTDYEGRNIVRWEASDCSIEHVRVMNSRLIGLMIGAAWLARPGAARCVINNVRFDNCHCSHAAMWQTENKWLNITDTGSMTYGGVLDMFSDRCTVTNYSVSAAGNHGLYGYRISRCTFTSVIAYNVVGAGLCLDNASISNKVQGGDFSQCGNCGIAEVGGSRDNTLNPTAANDNAQWGVMKQDCSGGSVGDVQANRNGYGGVAIIRSHGVMVTPAGVADSQGSGVYGEGSNNGLIIGGIIKNNAKAGNASDAALRLVDCSNWVIRPGQWYDDQAVKTQNHAIRTSGTSTGNQISDGSCTPNKTGTMALVGANKVRGVKGWVSLAQGVSNIAASATFVDVAHGLSDTPTQAQLSAILAGGLSGGATGVIVDNANITATQFRVKVLGTAPTAALYFRWEANMEAA